MRHHRKVVAVALQNFVVDTKACFAGRAVFLYFCHINALKRRKLIPPVTNYKNSHHLRYLSSPGDSSGNPDQCPLRSWSHISRLPVRWHRCRQTLSLRWLESRRVRREYIGIRSSLNYRQKVLTLKHSMAVPASWWKAVFPDAAAMITYGDSCWLFIYLEFLRRRWSDWWVIGDRSWVRKWIENRAGPTFISPKVN